MNLGHTPINKEGYVMKNKKEKILAEKRAWETEILRNEICKVQEEMAVTLNNFSNAIEPELLEYYTYFYKASEIKHTYMLKRLKKLYYNQ